MTDQKQSNPDLTMPQEISPTVTLPRTEEGETTVIQSRKGEGISHLSENIVMKAHDGRTAIVYDLK